MSSQPPSHHDLITNDDGHEVQGVDVDAAGVEVSAEPRHLTRTQLFMLAVASAVVTANAYYIHPIIARVADGFDVSASLIGIVPAFNQIALALGIFLLLPLGDRVSNRRLTAVFVAGQFVGLVVMALAAPFWLFVAGSTLLGFFTIAPYLLPAYVSKRVADASLGEATAVLTTGIIAGILLARVGAGVLGQYLGWRTVYYIAATLMAVVAVLLPLIMEEREPGARPRSEESYFQLLGSIGPIVRANPGILLSGMIQACSFGIFLSVWMGLGLHLTSDQMGYGVDTVGYLAAFTLLNLFVTPQLGRWADRIGAYRARLSVAVVQMSGVVLLFLFGHSLWLLMIPIVIMNLSGPTIDITSRMTFLSAAPQIRTRLMTVYIVAMFVGGGIASWAGTATYDLWGWTGTASLAFGLSAIVLSLAWASHRWQQR